MWYFALVGLWVMRGGTMDTKPTDLPATILPAPRTRADVETDLVLCMVVLKRERQRGGLKVAEYERELDALQDEWAALKSTA